MDQTKRHRHKHFKSAAEHADKCYVGTCPKCRQHVLWDTPEGPIWACPRDLSDANPFRSFEAPYSEADMERDGIYSQCGEDRGDPCEERMPLHSRCYATGNY